MQRVQKLQNFAERVAIDNVRKFDHISLFLRKLEWLRIKDKYVLEICTFIYNSLRNNVPDWLYSFATVNSVSEINTRRGEDLFVKRAKTDIGLR